MLDKQKREYYLRRGAGSNFDELRGVLDSVNKKLEDVISVDDVRDTEEYLDGGRENPNMRWVGTFYSDGREIKFHVNGNVDNGTVSIEMRYPSRIDSEDIGKIGRVLTEEGFEKTEKRVYL